MAFDQSQATNLSNLFRSACTMRLDSRQLSEFEGILQSVLGIKNRRNVQLWTRQGAIQRNFINRNLGEFELDIRTWIAQKFVFNPVPNFPVKVKAFFMPINSEGYAQITKYFIDPYIREYTNRIYFDNLAFVIEYAADSNTNPDEIDLDSPEFEDILDDIEF